MDNLPPTGRLARSRVVGKALLRVGVTQTKGVIKRSLGSRVALKRFAKGKNVDHLMSEISSRLYEEVDYEQEAENGEFFREYLRLDRIVIPKVYRSFSSGKVLVTSLLEGQSFESFIASNPSQDRRNHYAQLIFDSFFYSLYYLQRIHADPNPGNFIFMDEGRLGIIDFGCVKQIEGDFLEAYTRLHHHLFEEAEETQIIEEYTRLGMIERGSDHVE